MRTDDPFLGEKANLFRETLEPVEGVEVVDRYTVKFVLKRTLCMAGGQIGQPERHVDYRP